MYGSYLRGSPQMQLAGSANGLGSFVPNPGIPQIESAATQQHGVSAVNPFFPNIGMGNFDVGTGFPPERNPPAMSAQSVSGAALPQPPLLKKGRGSKGARKGRSGLRRTKTS
ncbi:hypothetical protein E8E13_000157 [Curvularia kusanoi]|uniref:Uncharacterized protein n=1 Tax=Curvularia kusanoi TaxID=90978 RepID=A0A9P4TIK1_CURKU|nr:hypothetical protein E8E13_000157 [Curvularia kusanoi]